MLDPRTHDFRGELMDAITRATHHMTPEERLAVIKCIEVDLAYTLGALIGGRIGALAGEALRGKAIATEVEALRLGSTVAYSARRNAHLTHKRVSQ